MPTDDLLLDPPVFAEVDSPAGTARDWLARRFAAQARDTDPAALDPSELIEIAELLSDSWWERVFVAGDDDGVAPADRLRAVLPAAVRAAAAIPEGSTVLALYLRHLVNEAWELAWDHSLLAVAIHTACDAAALDSPGRDAVTRQAWTLLGFMDREFQVETALLTGRLATVVAATRTAADAAADIVAAIEPLPAGPGRDAVHAEASREATYYGAVAACADAVEEVMRGDRPGLDLDELRRQVAAAGFRPRDASELRGHLASTEAVLEAQDCDRLRVDQGRVRIVYPFGVRTGARHDPISIVDALHAAAVERHRAGGDLEGFTIAEVRSRLDLADVWQGTDTFGRGYRGATILLGSLAVWSPDVAAPLEVIRPSIQLSQLGNHALVFDIDLMGADAYRVAETISLATPVYGDLTEITGLLRLAAGDGPGLPGLPYVVDALLDAMRGLLAAVDAGTGETALAARAGSFGVVVTVLAASRIGPAGVESLANAAELLDLWGVQPLIHPLPSGAAGVVDWAMYDLDAVTTWPLLHLNRELLAANSNVTLLASFTSPAYAVHEVGSFATFAHSLHGVYQGWQDALRAHADEIATLLRSAERLLHKADTLDRVGAHGISARRGIVIDDLDRLVRKIERAELALQAFVQSNEATMLFIESPAIVTSPPLRIDLDTVLASNGYGRLRAGYTQAVRDVVGTPLRPLLDVVHRRMQQAYAAQGAALDAQRERRAREAAEARDRRDRRFARVFELLGVVFAVIGLSGLVSILQEGHPEWDGSVSWLLVAVIVAAAMGCGVVLLAWMRMRRSGPDQKDRP